MGRKPTAPEHGVARYAKGECRCDICRDAWAGYIRAYKNKKRSQTADEYYIGRTERLRVRLTPLAASIARATSIRGGRQIDDVVEEALRLHAQTAHEPL